jgi:hypothetical protein
MTLKSNPNIQIKRDSSLIKQLETNSEKDARAQVVNKWEGIRDDFYRSGSTRNRPIYNRRPA